MSVTPINLPVITRSQPEYIRIFDFIPFTTLLWSPQDFSFSHKAETINNHNSLLNLARKSVKALERLAIRHQYCCSQDEEPPSIFSWNIVSYCVTYYPLF